MDSDFTPVRVGVVSASIHFVRRRVQPPTIARLSREIHYKERVAHFPPFVLFVLFLRLRVCFFPSLFFLFFILSFVAREGFTRTERSHSQREKNMILKPEEYPRRRRGTDENFITEFFDLDSSRRCESSRRMRRYARFRGNLRACVIPTEISRMREKLIMLFEKEDKAYLKLKVTENSWKSLFNHFSTNCTTLFP